MIENFFQELRRKSGLDAVELAALLDVNVNSIILLERGYFWFGSETVERLAEVLEVPANHLELIALDKFSEIPPKEAVRFMGYLKSTLQEMKEEIALMSPEYELVAFINSHILPNDFTDDNPEMAIEMTERMFPVMKEAFKKQIQYQKIQNAYNKKFGKP